MKKREVIAPEQYSLAETLEDLVDAAVKNLPEDESNNLRDATAVACMGMVINYLQGVEAVSEVLQENQNLEEAQKGNLIAWLSFTAEDHKRIALLADSIQRGVV